MSKAERQSSIAPGATHLRSRPQLELHVVIEPRARASRRSARKPPVRGSGIKHIGAPAGDAHRSGAGSGRCRRAPAAARWSSAEGNRGRTRPARIIRLASPSASAWSVPGRTCSHWSARLAKAVGRGSTTIMRAPRLTRLLHLGRPREPGGGGVVAPQQHAVGVGEVGRADVGAVREARGEILVPVADLGGVDGVGAAVGADEALDPGNRIREVRAARRRRPRMRPAPARARP